ncbi:MAG: DNA polymerase I [Phycisphaerae bacterium]|nr:DNA polymerase I [Phycisphaerae bacterium]
MQEGTFYLIDGYAQFFRAFYAIRTPMSSPVTHEPTNMTYGYCDMMRKLVRQHDPAFLAVALDVGGDQENFRAEIYPEYKANRNETPEEFPVQVDRCLELMEQMAVPVYGHEGSEADDVIATIVKRVRAEHPDIRIRIISRDKDLSQLLDENVELYDVHKDESLDAAGVFKIEGITPDLVIDMLALMGDSVDNIQGVDGVGPKTAAKLLFEYGSIEGIYENISQIKGKRKENLLQSRDRMDLNRTLVTLVDDIPIDFDLEQARFDTSKIDATGLIASLRELGFDRLTSEWTQILNPSASTGAVQEAPVIPGGLFDGAGEAAQQADPEAEYILVSDAAALEGLVQELSSAKEITLDTETDGLRPRSSALAGLSFSHEQGRAFYVPVNSPEPGEHLGRDVVLEALRPVLESGERTIVGHNLKFDLNVLRANGVDVAGPFFDTLVADHVIEPLRSSHGLDFVVQDLLGYECIPIQSLIGRGKSQKKFSEVPLVQAAPYAAEDADMTHRIGIELDNQLHDDPDLDELFHQLEMPLVQVLASMEYAGITVDPDELRRQRDRLEQQAATLRQQIIDASPRPFNPDSPKQLASVLFDAIDADPPGLGLKPVKKRKTGPSTDSEVLDKLESDPLVSTPIPGLVLEYRKLTKLIGTYLVALEEAIDPGTGRVHASFHQAGTATGRLSSSDPNLQNIPIRTEAGRAIRRAFIAAEGCRLVTADYSQIELRILAHLSGDESMINAFKSGEDIHVTVAAEVFGVTPDSVTSQQRDAAKMVNFGIVYGVTPYGLARRLGDDWSNARAADLIDRYKERFPGIQSFMDQCIEEAHHDGYVQTIMGRRRPVQYLESGRSQAEQSLGERIAINTVVQGSAADLIKKAMILLSPRLSHLDESAQLLLQIHDELVLEVRESLAEQGRDLLVEVMQNAMALEVPLVVEASISERWDEAK